MMKKRSGFIKAITVACLAIIMIASACVITSASGDELNIKYCNLSFESDTHIMYAIKSADPNVKLLVWLAPQTEYLLGTQTAILDPLDSKRTINGEEYTVFKYTGLAAKQMTDDVYVRACIEKAGGNEYGNVQKYSILQYAYNKLGKTGTPTTNEKLKTMLTSMLTYGASAQQYHNYKTDRLATDNFVQIKLTNGTLPDGFSKGFFLEGETVKIKPHVQANTNGTVSWKDSEGNIVGNNEYTITAGNENQVLTPAYVKYSEGLAFTLNDDGLSYSVSGIGTCTDTEIVIPATYEDKPVTVIGNRAFYDCTSLTSVNIPESVTSIVDWAFSNCSSLKSINIPESVTSIVDWAFFNCSSLKSINIPEGVTSISSYAFCNCSSLKSINVPESVTSISDSAFNDCSALEQITVSSGNTVYHSSGNCLIETATKTLIQGCKNSIIPEDGSVTSIGHSAFFDCSSLTSINIPEGVTSIENYAFYGCSSLTSINIPEGITIISEGTFRYCSSLTSINIPECVTSINRYAFNDCSALEQITVSSGNTVYHSSGNCLIETATKTLIQGCKNSIIPEDGSITSIGNSAFDGCSSLTSINIPEGVTSIGDSAFYGCSSLTSINIPESVTSISSYAFWNCSSLKSINIPEGVTIIGNYTFSRCTSLTSINYSGTISKWNAITKGTRWNSNTGNYTIYCKDGIVAKDRTVTITCTHEGTIVTDPAVAPSCTATGLTEGSHCSYCDTIIVKQQIILTKDHISGNPVIENRVEPIGCVTPGSYDKVVYCTGCPTEISRIMITIDAIGHNTYLKYEAYQYMDCDGDGTAEYCKETITCCTNCDLYQLDRTQVYLPSNFNSLDEAKLYHRLVYREITFEEVDGNINYTTLYKSMDENTYYPNQEITHNIDMNNKQEPTCTQTGYSYWSCNGEECRGSFIIYIPALYPQEGHIRGTEIGRTNPTCTDAGIIKYSCTRCSGTITDVGDPALYPDEGHIQGEEINRTAPNCAPEVITYKCSRCLVEYTVEGKPGDPYKHNIQTLNVGTPSCTTIGFKLTYCINPGCTTYLYTQEQIGGKGHNTYIKYEAYQYMDCDDDGTVEYCKEILTCCTKCDLHQLDRTPAVVPTGFNSLDEAKLYHRLVYRETTFEEVDGNINYTTVYKSMDENTYYPNQEITHSIVDMNNKQEPTCTQTGYSYWSCNGEGCTGEFVVYHPALHPDEGHNFVDGQCTKCEATE